MSMLGWTTTPLSEAKALTMLVRPNHKNTDSCRSTSPTVSESRPSKVDSQVRPTCRSTVRKWRHT